MVVASSTSETAVAGSVTVIVGGRANRVSWIARYPTKPATTSARNRPTKIAARDREPLARRGDRPRNDDRGLDGGRVAPLTAPLLEDLVGVEAEVERVVAQEALGVDGPGQVPPLALLERGQVAGADLRVALGSRKVDALVLAGREQALRQRAGREDRRARTSRPRRSSRARDRGIAVRGGVPIPSGRASAGVAVRRRVRSRVVIPRRLGRQLPTLPPPRPEPGRGAAPAARSSRRTVRCSRAPRAGR